MLRAQYTTNESTESSGRSERTVHLRPPKPHQTFQIIPLGNEDQDKGTDPGAEGDGVFVRLQKLEQGAVGDAVEICTCGNASGGHMSCR